MSAHTHPYKQGWSNANQNANVDNDVNTRSPIERNKTTVLCFSIYL